jgi:acyl-CoA thioester hydrolase
MFTSSVHPRFYETDAFGHVNNTVVAGWFETAREPIFRIFTPDMDIRKLSLILARTEIDFVAQIHYGSEVMLSAAIEKIGNRSFTVLHEAWQNGVCCARGRAVQVYFDFGQQVSAPIPDHFREILARYLVAPA